MGCTKPRWVDMPLKSINRSIVWAWYNCNIPMIRICEIDIGNLKTRNFTKNCFSTQPTRGARSTQSRLASPSSESQPSSSEAGTQLPAFSQISAHAYGAWHHPNTLVPISIRDFYFDISEWHILSACAWTPALMLNLTNPCAKRKVLSLTKPKGKIYKTKSLGNYITQQ